jgi:hypothetical protein
MQFLITNPVNFCLVCVGICIIILGYLIFYVISKYDKLLVKHKGVFNRVSIIESKTLGMGDKFDILFSDTEKLMDMILDTNEKIDRLEISKISSKRKASKIKDAK